MFEVRSIKNGLVQVDRVNTHGLAYSLAETIIARQTGCTLPLCERDGLGLKVSDKAKTCVVFIRHLPQPLRRR